MDHDRAGFARLVFDGDGLAIARPLSIEGEESRSLAAQDRMQRRPSVASPRPSCLSDISRGSRSRRGRFGSRVRWRFRTTRSRVSFFMNKSNDWGSSNTRMGSRSTSRFSPSSYTIEETDETHRSGELNRPRDRIKPTLSCNPLSGFERRSDAGNFEVRHRGCGKEPAARTRHPARDTSRSCASGGIGRDPGVGIHLSI